MSNDDGDGDTVHRSSSCRLPQESVSSNKRLYASLMRGFDYFWSSREVFFKEISGMDSNLVWCWDSFQIRPNYSHVPLDKIVKGVVYKKEDNGDYVIAFYMVVME